MMARKKKSTQETFDENVKKLAENAPKQTAAKAKPKVKPKTSPSIPNHHTKIKKLEEYTPKVEDFDLYSYYKAQQDEDDKSGYYVGSILCRSLADMEKRVGFYLDNTTKQSKKELKVNLIKDLESIKKRIRSL